MTYVLPRSRLCRTPMSYEYSARQAPRSWHRAQVPLRVCRAHWGSLNAGRQHHVFRADGNAALQVRACLQSQADQYVLRSA